MKTKRKIEPYLYLLPALVILLLFRFIPILMSFVISFFDFGVTDIGKFLGFAHYSRLFGDQEFWQSMMNTLWLVLIALPASIILPLIFAQLLNQIKWLKGFFRTIYFMPFVTSLVAVSIVWKIIYSEQAGLANMFLQWLGLEPQLWLAEPRGIFTLFFQSLGVQIPGWMGGPSLALFSIIIMTVWKGLGYNTIIYLAGLQNISKAYYEAADIDGAGKIRQFFNITVPLISPTTFYVLLMTTIVSFQTFAQIYMMTDKGGPLGTTKLIVYYIYEKGFDKLDMGYASAAAIILFIVILGLTLLQRRLESKVNY
ncbi:MAG: sugar ABC transporter permease [Candidatus Cloacimonetes bacterium]|nr:sugar ABC transporter permease [Candidatus Cloacimonadota bacterium]